jgi:hypothetical protein
MSVDDRVALLSLVLAPGEDAEWEILLAQVTPLQPFTLPLG